jgi:hypothetical protein
MPIYLLVHQFYRFLTREKEIYTYWRVMSFNILKQLWGPNSLVKKKYIHIGEWCHLTFLSNYEGQTTITSGVHLPPIPIKWWLATMSSVSQWKRKFICIQMGSLSKISSPLYYKVKQNKTEAICTHSTFVRARTHVHTCLSPKLHELHIP